MVETGGFTIPQKPWLLYHGQLLDSKCGGTMVEPRGVSIPKTMVILPRFYHGQPRPLSAFLCRQI